MDLDKPLRPLTRPPEDMEKSYLPSSDRLMVMGKRFETSSKRESTFVELLEEDEEEAEGADMVERVSIYLKYCLD